MALLKTLKNNKKMASNEKVQEAIIVIKQEAEKKNKAQRVVVYKKLS